MMCTVGSVKMGKTGFLEFLKQLRGKTLLVAFLYAEARSFHPPIWADGRIFLVTDGEKASIVVRRLDREITDTLDRYITWTGYFQRIMDFYEMPHERGMKGFLILIKFVEEHLQEKYPSLKEALEAVQVNQKTARSLCARKLYKPNRRGRKNNPEADPRQLRFFDLLKKK